MLIFIYIYGDGTNLRTELAVELQVGPQFNGYLALKDEGGN